MLKGKQSKDIIVHELCQNYTGACLMRLLSTSVIYLVRVGRHVVVEGEQLLASESHFVLINPKLM